MYEVLLKGSDNINKNEKKKREEKRVLTTKLSGEKDVMKVLCYNNIDIFCWIQKEKEITVSLPKVFNFYFISID